MCYSAISRGRTFQDLTPRTSVTFAADIITIFDESLDKQFTAESHLSSLPLMTIRAGAEDNVVNTTQTFSQDTLSFLRKDWKHQMR